MKFCLRRDSANNRNLDQLDPALEEARRAGIDLDLLDSNLALTVEQRWKQPDAALELVEEYETSQGEVVPEEAMIRWIRSRGRLVLEVRAGHNGIQTG